MDDRELVAALVDGDPRGLDGAYRTYAAPLFAYCRRLLSDDDAAADAVQDTFLLAGQRAGQLRDPDRLRGWLYAIARNECLRQLRGRARSVPLDEAGPLRDPGGDPQAGAPVDHVRELVWSAAASLSEGDRHVFELMVGHDLSAADVGAVLGISVDHAHARLSRARVQLQRALGVLLVARSGSADCPELARLVRGWTGALTPLLRKRIGRHIDDCPTCRSRQHDELRPAALLAAYGAAPFVLVPPATAGSGLSTVVRLDPVSGFPPPVPAADAPLGRPVHARGRGRLLAAAGLVALLVLGGTVATVAAAPDALDLGAAGPTTPAIAAATGHLGPAPTGTATSPGTPSVDPPVDPSTPSSPGPTRTPRRGTGTPPPATVDATGVVAPSVCPRWLLAVTAVQTGGAMRDATLYWRTGSAAVADTPMTVTGATAKGAATNLLGTAVTWWVVVRTVAGQTVTTPRRTLPRPPGCH